MSLVPVTRATLLPVVVSRDDRGVSPDALTEDFVGELRVGYLIGDPADERMLTRRDLDSFGLSHRDLRRAAAEGLYEALDGIGIHGQPPALMLSFDGIESSALLAHRFWDDLERSVPGELVVGAPARDVVIFTGSGSSSGMEKVRRAVDRVLFAGGSHLLSNDLLVRRQRCWQVLESDPSVLPPLSPPPMSSAPPPRSPAPAPPYSPAPVSPYSAVPASPFSAVPARPSRPVPVRSSAAVPARPAPAVPAPQYSGAPARSSAAVPARPYSAGPARSYPVAPAPPQRSAPPAPYSAPPTPGRRRYQPVAAAASPPVRVPHPRTPRSSAPVR